MLDGYKNVREWRIWTQGGARQEKQCRFGGRDVENVECVLRMLDWCVMAKSLCGAKFSQDCFLLQNIFHTFVSDILKLTTYPNNRVL